VVPVAVVVTTVGGLEEIAIALEVPADGEAKSVYYQRLPAMLAVFHPDGDWADGTHLPSRTLTKNEEAFWHLH
jgi:hypothetical protein